MNNCEICTKKPDQVPFSVHEADMARMERTVKRLWILLLVLVVLFVGSNASWIWYESKFVEESWTFEANTDDGGTAIANGDGEVYYYGQGESNQENPNP